MFLIIISLILTVTTAFFLALNINNLTLNFKKKKVLFSLVWLLLILFGCFSTVSTGEIGIKTRFGKITNTYLSEGINFKLPFEKIEKINIKVQKYENEVPLETSTKDMQIVNSIMIAANYQIEADKAISLYRNVGNGYKETVLEPAIQETVKSVISKYTAEEIITKRAEVADDIQVTLAEKVSNYGINIISVSLKNFDFSLEYNAAIEKKAVAEQNVLTAQQELETTKINAEKKKVEAQAEADANKIKEQTLTDKILMQQFLEKWDGKLPTVTSDNNIFDITGLLK